MLGTPTLYENVTLVMNSYAGTNIRIGDAGEALESCCADHEPKGRHWYTYPLDAECLSRPVRRLLPRI